MSIRAFLVAPVFFLAAILSLSAPANASEILIDAVLASVDGKPITLQDITRRLPRAGKMSLKELAGDHEAKLVLETLIMEQVIIREAEDKKLGVSNSEIEEYIDEVARRNNLSREGFTALLAAENKSLEEYKKVLKIDILKSKLTSSYVRGAVTVTEAEIDAFLEAHPQLSKSGAKVKLSQILITPVAAEEEEALKKIRDIKAELDSGGDFAELAALHSHGSEAPEGGGLGIMAEEDLSPAIFDAIFSLQPGQHSEIVSTGAGFHIFRLDERLVEKKGKDKGANPVREEVRKAILSQKMQEKMNSFFTEDLYRAHSIDRKI